jgi:hypothetical protein
MMQQKFNKSARQLAEENLQVPGVSEALALASVPPSPYGSDQRDNFAAYFSALAQDNKPLHEVPAEVLWSSLLNLPDQRIGQHDAVNVFIGPIAEALLHKFRANDMGSVLIQTDIDFMGGEAQGRIANQKWLSDENRTAVKRLGRAVLTN